MQPRRRIVAAGLGLAALAFGVVSCSSSSDSTTVKPPACSPSVASLDFGSVPLGSSKDLTFSVTNVGQGTLAGTVASPCGDYSIQSTPSYSLGAGALATFTVRFTPSQTGTRPCALDVGAGCAAVSCTGIGASPCQVSLGSLNFGTVIVNQSADLSFTITNAGSGTLSGTVTSPCGEYTFVGSASYTLAPGAFATLTVRFTPSQTGTRPCVLDVGAGCAAVSCTGIGASPCQVSPNSLNFGTVALGQSADLSFTITNAGSGTLAGTVTSPCAEYTFVGSAGYALVGPGFKTITVRFTPSTSGASSCTLDTGSPDCHSVACGGSGGPELGSPLLGNGATYQHTFASAGTYPYHCSIHTFMQGTVIVSAGAPASASVAIQSFTFSPSTVSVAPGGTVTWTNNDGASHTVTSD
jgi:plastocyanin